MCEVCGALLCSIEGNEQPLLSTTLSSEAIFGLSEVDQADIQKAVQSLLSPGKWSTTDITYTFTNNANDYATGATYYGEENGFQKLSSAGEDMMRVALSVWDDLSGLTITEANKGGDIAIAGSTYPSTAWAYTPNSRPAGGDGDIWIGTTQSYNALFVAQQETTYVGSYEYLVAMHEIGHALGLKHPHSYYFDADTEVMSTEFDALEYTVMSYRSYLGGFAGGYTVDNGEYPQSLMMLDIAAIQDLYGADYSENSGDTVYSFSPNTGEMLINGVSAGAVMTNVIFRTLWDGGGTDLIDLSQYSTSIAANLNAGGAISLDTDSFAQTSVLGGTNASPIYASANIYMSLLYGGNTQSLIENITTGSGDDVITGNEADNILTPAAGVNIVDGGDGEDTVRLLFAASAVSVYAASGVLNAVYADGSVEMTNVEFLETSDATYSVATLLSGLSVSGDNVSVSLPVFDGPITDPVTGSSLSGMVFTDYDADGVFNGIDTVLSGWTVFLDTNDDGILDSGETSHQTDENGYYVFTDLQDGQYNVALIEDPSLGASAPSEASTPTQTVVIASNSVPVVIGNVDFAVLDTLDTTGTPDTAGTTEVFAEFGVISALDDNWTTITLSETFENPVVFAFVNTENGDQLVTTRLQNIGPDSFEIRLQEANYLDGTHIDETVSYVVMEAGTWELSDGRMIEVGSLQTDLLTRNAFESVSFSTSFDADPYVFSNVQTYDGGDYVTTRQQSVTVDGFMIAMEEEEANAKGTHLDETVGWFATDGGVSYVDDFIFEASSLIVDSSDNDTYALQGTYDDNVYLLSNISSYNGADSSTVRVSDANSSSFDLFIQEDQSLDTELTHLDETVNVFAFSGLGTLDAMRVYDIA